MGPELVASVLAAATAVLSAVASTEVLRTIIRRVKPQKGDLTLDSHELETVAQALREDLGPGSGSGKPAEGEAGSQRATTSTPAEIEALAILKVYGQELLAEAGRIAKRAGAERPSKIHVRHAADRIGVLRDRAGVATDVALIVGSILIGAAVSYQVNLWTGGRAAEGAGIWMTLVLAAGVGILVAAATIKWRRS